MAFNRGPNYGLSAEVKNKVGANIVPLHSKVNFAELFPPPSTPCAFCERECGSHLGLHFDMRTQVKRLSEVKGKVCQKIQKGLFKESNGVYCDRKAFLEHV